MRRRREQAGAIEAVVGLARVAPRDAVQRCPGQVRLQLEDAPGVRLRLRIARHGEHAADVVEVQGPQLLGLLVVAEVVIAIGKAQATLVHPADHLGRVLEVLAGAEAEEGARAAAVQLRDPACQAAGVRDLVDRLQLLAQGGERGRLGLLLVHAGGVEVAHLLGEGVRGIGRAAGVLLHDLAQHRLVALQHLAEAATPLRAVFGDGRPGEPAPASELVEVVAGTHRAIHRGEIDPRRRRLPSEASGRLLLLRWNRRRPGLPCRLGGLRLRAGHLRRGRVRRRGGTGRRGRRLGGLRGRGGLAGEDG